MDMEPIRDLCRRHDLLAVYLFGSRADDGLAKLAGQPVSGEGSDLDVGVVCSAPSNTARSRSWQP